MKLYTEEQVRMLDINCENSTLDEIIGCLTPIYIPNNNELEEISKHEILYNNSKRSWWLEGAKWMRERIGGNNHIVDTNKMVNL